MVNNIDKICIIGLWHQGCVAAACLADLGYNVAGVDQNMDTILNLKRGRAPLFEPGLDDLLLKGMKSGNLYFTTELTEGLSNSYYALLMFDTPVNANDEVDLRGIFNTVREMAPLLLSGTTILVTAQVPVGTCGCIEKIIKEIRPELEFGIAYSPENLRLGQAIERFLNPPLPVIGANQARTLDMVEKLLSVIPTSWVRLDLRTAEMTKHALNAFLAVCVCYANELGNLCDEVGVDAHEVAKALRLEPRIGSKAMLFPGLGFSGGTLARDMITLQNLGDTYKCETYLIDGAMKTNLEQNKIVVHKLRRFFGSLKDKKICVWGLTYKPDTSTLRRSVAIEITRNLVEEGAVVKAYDPKADEQELKQHKYLSVCRDVYDAADQADVIVLITPWAEFKAVDFGKIIARMRQPFVFDPQNFLDGEELKRMGFMYLGIGRGKPLVGGGGK